MQITGSLITNKGFIGMFNQWVEESCAESNPVAKRYIEKIRDIWTTFHARGGDRSYEEILSIRVVETIKAIARQVLKDSPKKLEQVAQMEIRYSLTGGCHYNSDGKLEIQIDPRQFIEGCPQFDDGGSEELEDELLKDPSFMNFIVAHDVAHFKLGLDDLTSRCVRSADHNLKCLEKALSKNKSELKNLESFDRQWNEKEEKNQRAQELLVDAEVFRSVGSARSAKKFFYRKSYVVYHPLKTHPIDQDRVELAQNNLHVPTFVPQIQVPVMERAYELFWYFTFEAMDKLESCCKRKKE